MGLQDGDLPIAVDGKELAYFEGSILQEIANGETLTVEREGKQVEVAIPVDFMRAVLASKEPFFAMDLPARIDSIVPSSAGAAAGLRRGDEIVAINGEVMNRLSLVLPKICLLYTSFPTIDMHLRLFIPSKEHNRNI